jgi:hypothetical protein
MAHIGSTAATIGILAASVHASNPASASDGQMPAVVVHVSNCEPASADDRVAAQALVAAVYANVGIRLVWTGGSAAIARADGHRHVDLVILSEAMTRRKRPQPHPDALGESSPVSNRAYVHYSRVVEYARHTGSAAHIVLALAVAHELGHLLLPEKSHARQGLMSASFKGRIGHVPRFDPEQAATMHARLAAR